MLYSTQDHNQDKQLKLQSGVIHQWEKTKIEKKWGRKELFQNNVTMFVFHVEICWKARVFFGDKNKIKVVLSFIVSKSKEQETNYAESLDSLLFKETQNLLLPVGLF